MNQTSFAPSTGHWLARWASTIKIYSGHISNTSLQSILGCNGGWWWQVLVVAAWEQSLNMIVQESE